MEEDKPSKRNLFEGPKKWLLVSAFGLLLCLVSLTLHFSGGGSNSAKPVPKTVIAQVFGFNPYYFLKNKPPKGLRLDEMSVKFFGNAFSFDLVNGKKQKISVSQKAPVANPQSTETKVTQPLTTLLGSALVSPVKNGKISSTLVTKDQTEIDVESSDFLNSDILKEIYDTLSPIDRATGSPKIPE